MSPFLTFEECKQLTSSQLLTLGYSTDMENCNPLLSAHLKIWGTLLARIEKLEDEIIALKFPPLDV